MSLIVVSLLTCGFSLGAITGAGLVHIHRIFEQTQSTK